MKKLIIVLVLLLIGSFVGYKYMYQPHRDIASEEATFEMAATKFQGEFAANQQLAETKYLNKTVLVEGVVTEKETGGLTIANSVYISLESNKDVFLKVGDQVKVKGRCIGYDELLEFVKLDQSTIVNN